jgi:hypothetical protein
VGLQGITPTDKAHGGLRLGDEGGLSSHDSLNGVAASEELER